MSTIAHPEHSSGELIIEQVIAHPEHSSGELIIEQVIQGCEGARNISDDIIVYGQTKQEHNTRVCKVLERLRSHFESRQIQNFVWTD